MLSEEALLDGVDDVLHSRFYPNLFRLRVVSALTRRSRLTLFLAVRSLDELIPSIYAELLKYRRWRRSSLNEALRYWSGVDAPWTELVARILDAAPGANLVIWDHSHYRQHAHFISETIVGTTLSPLPELPAPVRTRTPTERGIEAAEQLQLEGGAERAEEVRRLYAAHMPDGVNRRFDPVPAEARRVLRSRHRKEVEKLHRISGVRVLQFPRTS